ncbi:hypothetical protein CLAFUW4_04459 [Fulvia fulva]|nr:hypothetical protein CLAFUR4_04445 [Fulvia fulva]KAK4627644.1 hypothetical protein CLAFUR0_04448 [Fulvia fulva]WPV14082.1 hypothetical protein CLAFUW4_04459 [Fulvia fulva]
MGSMDGSVLDKHLTSAKIIDNSAKMVDLNSAKDVVDPNAQKMVDVVGPMLEKRFGCIVIALVRVIGGQLISGVARAGIDVAKAHLEPESSKYKDFDEARRAFTPEMAKDFYEKREGGVIGVVCFNGGYTWKSTSQALRESTSSGMFTTRIMTVSRCGRAPLFTMMATGGARILPTTASVRPSMAVINARNLTARMLLVVGQGR